MSDQGDMLGMPGDVESLVGRDLGDMPESKWAKTLASLVDVLDDLYRRRGFTEEAAGALARDSVLTIAEYNGARMMYLPRGDALRLALRDAAIFMRARAGNIEQLAEEYKLTTIQIYRIIRNQKRLHIAKVQRNLPF